MFRQMLPFKRVFNSSRREDSNTTATWSDEKMYERLGLFDVGKAQKRVEFFGFLFGGSFLSSCLGKTSIPSMSHRIWFIVLVFLGNPLFPCILIRFILLLFVGIHINFAGKLKTGGGWGQGKQPPPPIRKLNARMLGSKKTHVGVICFQSSLHGV